MLEIILAVRSQERQTSNSGLYGKTRGTRTVQARHAGRHSLRSPFASPRRSVRGGGQTFLRRVRSAFGM